MDYLSEEKVISGFFGQTEVVEFEFANQEAQKQAFSINIEDPDLKLLEKPEFQLITNPTEWKFFVDKKHFPKPPEWNLISKENVFMLNPREKVTLLFKFLSYRKVDPSEGNRNSKRRAAAEETDINRAEYIATRTVNVFINQLKGRVYGGFSVRVEPHNQIVDHCFRFFERENRSTSLMLPSLYHMSNVPITKPLLHVTYPKSTVEWLSDREIGINMKTPSAANILNFNLIAYDDSYCSEIIGNWLIELHSLAGLDVNVNMGQLTGSKLTLPGDIPRLCKLYTSHPLYLTFPSPFNKAFTMSAGRINVIDFNIRSFSEEPMISQINCVDLDSKELVYSWIVRIDTNKPNVTKIFDINSKLGIETVQK